MFLKSNVLVEREDVTKYDKKHEEELEEYEMLHG